LNGTWLKKNDSVAFKRPAQHTERHVSWYTRYANPAFARPAPLRFVADRLWQNMHEQQQQSLLLHDWHVAPDSDRMGFRLAESLPGSLPVESMLSSAVAFGSIQIPPDQRPIILAADRQTTGGYPLMGTLAGISHSSLAQLKPGDTVRFELIELAQAQSQWRQRELPFRQWQTQIKNWWQSARD
jgi:allophanate hydrolase subunit 2